MYKVDGFLFEDEATAELAKKEEEGVRFIKERTALNNPEVVYKLYKKLLDQELFVTPVGQRFLVELQNIILASGYVPTAEIPPIKVAKVEDVINDYIKKDVNTIVVDPPRKGLDAKVAESILSVKPNKIIYISCNPSTLARDLKIFAKDYSISFVQPFDMFPQTAHVETVVELVKI